MRAARAIVGQVRQVGRVGRVGLVGRVGRVGQVGELFGYRSLILRSSCIVGIGEVVEEEKLLLSSFF